MQISVNGIDRIIAGLKAYQNRLENQKKRFLEELAKIGIDTAEIKFAEATYDGNFDVQVGQSPEWQGENTLFVYATGETVAFVEFGTGKGYAGTHPLSGSRFYAGSYGQGKGANNAWGYYGEAGSHKTADSKTIYRDGQPITITKGNPPARAMYEAGKAMREKIVEIAKEVFVND